MGFINTYIQPSSNYIESQGLNMKLWSQEKEWYVLPKVQTSPEYFHFYVRMLE